MKTAVITGPTGAIGLALIEALTKKNIKVYAVVRPDSRRKDRIQEGPLLQRIECDLKEIKRLPELITEPVELFYHFAWDGTFGSTRNDMHLQNRNVAYALDAVETAAALGCSAFIGAGSQAEYGRVEGKLQPQTPAFPENGYGMAKLCAGQMTRVLCRQKGIRHIWTRILSIYGPYDGMGTMVMSTIDKLMRGERPACTAGEQMWDYLYAKDAGTAMALLGEKGRDGKIYCIGSGQARPLKEYILDIRNAVAPGADIGFGEIPYGPKQVMSLCADITELQKDTGFQPAYPFQDGIRETAAWYKKTTESAQNQRQ